MTRLIRAITRAIAEIGSIYVLPNGTIEVHRRVAAERRRG